MKNLQKAITTLSNFTPHHAAIQQEVSKSSVGWHVAHSYLVILGIGSALVASDPTAYKSSFNLKRTVVLLLGKFPRGKAKAPERVLPKGDITESYLAELAEKANDIVSKFANLPAKANFQHPFFGVLHKKTALQILALHTQHHIKIMKDILAK